MYQLKSHFISVLLLMFGLYGFAQNKEPNQNKSQQWYGPGILIDSEGNRWYQVQIGPNPFSSFLVLPEGINQGIIAKVEVFNNQMELVISQKFERNKIDTSWWQSGSYTLVLYDKKGHVLQKNILIKE